jgi:hypothetical protein
MKPDNERKLNRGLERLERAAEALESGAERLEAAAGKKPSLDDAAVGELQADLFNGLEQVSEAFLGRLDDELGRVVGGLVDVFVGLQNPGWGLVGDLLSILGFAKGGRVTEPTLAMVGEGGAPEYIIPEPDMQAALSGGVPGVVDLLSQLGGNVQRAGAAPAPSTTNVYNSYGLAVGSLDRLDSYNRRGEARRARRAY